MHSLSLSLYTGSIVYRSSFIGKPFSRRKQVECAYIYETITYHKKGISERKNNNKRKRKFLSVALGCYNIMGQANVLLGRLSLTYAGLSFYELRQYVCALCCTVRVHTH